MKKHIVRALILGFGLPFHQVYAQQLKPPAPCAEDQLLRIKWFPEDKPGLTKFPENSIMEAVADPKSSVTPASLGIRGLRMETWCEDGIGHFRVGLMTARPAWAAEDMIAEHSVKTGDKFHLDALQKFGIRAWDVEVIAAERKKAYLPTVATETASLEVSAEQVSATLPSVKVVVKNNSKKAVAGYDVEMRTGSELRGNIQIRNRRVTPIIAPGESYGAVFPIYYDRDADLSADKIANLQTNEVIIVKAAVFEDGTAEGDPFAIWRIKARTFGDKEMVSIAAAMIEKLLNSENLTVESAQAGFDALPKQIEPARLDELVKLSGFQGNEEAGRLRGLGRTSYGMTRSELLKDIAYLRSGRFGETVPETTRRWLQGVLLEYKSWLKRL